MSPSHPAFTAISLLVVISLLVSSAGLAPSVEAALRGPDFTSASIGNATHLSAQVYTPLPLPTLAAPPPTPTDHDILHHGSPSAPWTTFVGPGVNVVFGNFAGQELDLSVPGRGLGFAFLRTYNKAKSRLASAICIKDDRSTNLLKLVPQKGG